MISDVEVQGGAARAAGRLAQGLGSAHEVVRIVAHAAAEPDPSWTTEELRGYPTLTKGLRKISRVGAEMSSDRLAQRRLRSMLEALRPDFISVHNLHGASSHGWSIEFCGLCCEVAPTVWTLHDMWSFTGSCAYSYGSAQWEMGCSEACSCPPDYPRAPQRHLAPEWRSRRRILRNNPELAAVTPSRWLHDAAKRGLWSTHRVEVIPYSVPLQRLRPGDREEARRKLGLEAHRPTLLIAAADLSDRRKGAGIVLEALASLRTDVSVLTMGAGALEQPSRPSGWRQLGLVHDENVLATAFNAADLLVHPALQDNFPLVVQEALACGTPTAAFEVGGLPELIEEGVTGWLAPAARAADLAAAIERGLEQVVSDPSLRERCRAVAESRFSPAAETARYLELARALGCLAS